MTDSDFSREVLEAFRGLLDRGELSVESSTYSARDFGNASVILTAPQFRLKVDRDRGVTDADIASTRDPEDWYPLEWIVAALVGNAPPEPRAFSPRYAAGLVEEHLHEIRAALSEEWANVTRPTLKGFDDDRMREIWGDDWRSAGGTESSGR